MQQSQSDQRVGHRNSHDGHDDRGDRGAMAAAIARSTVQLLSEYTGRGPTKARAYISADLITVVLRDTMNHGERSLVREGRTELVLAVRKAYQDTMGPSLIEAVEQHSGQRVLAFLSDNHLDPDIAVESFVMAPPGDEPNSSEHDQPS